MRERIGLEDDGCDWNCGNKAGGDGYDGGGGATSDTVTLSSLAASSLGCTS